MTTEMKLSQAGASVAVSLAAYGVMFGMDPFEAVEAAEGVLKAACVQHDPRRGRKVTRMLGEVPVVEVMVAMGEIIDAQGSLRREFVDDQFPETGEADEDPVEGNI